MKGTLVSGSQPFDSKAPYCPQQYSKALMIFPVVLIYWIRIKVKKSSWGPLRTIHSFINLTDSVLKIKTRARLWVNSDIFQLVSQNLFYGFGLRTSWTTFMVLLWGFWEAWRLQSPILWKIMTYIIQNFLLSGYTEKSNIRSSKL